MDAQKKKKKSPFLLPQLWLTSALEWAKHPAPPAPNSSSLCLANWETRTCHIYAAWSKGRKDFVHLSPPVYESPSARVNTARMVWACFAFLANLQLRQSGTKLEQEAG